MKTLVNLTTSPYDLDRFSTQQDLISLIEEFGLDGVELLACDDDPRGIVPKDLVVGQHMIYFPYWLDFYRGDEEALLGEFGSLEECENVYGGTTKHVLVERFREDFRKAEEYGAEYAVFHVSDAGINEAISGRYRHTSAEVIDATCELLSEVLSGMRYRPKLLLENLWQPGLTLTDPEMTRRLLEGVPYENAGLMLDTGHLFHTNEDIASQQEGLRYISAVLDRLGNLSKRIEGVHLHQSITGAYAKAARERLPALGATYRERARQMLTHAFAIDRHLPFICDGVRELVERIDPEYLVYEFLTSDTAQQKTFLAEQKRALNG